jgi:hypothetical protein
MTTTLIFLLAFNGGFIGGVCYYRWAHGYVCGAILWLVSLPGLFLDAIDPTLPVYRQDRKRSS